MPQPPVLIFYPSAKQACGIGMLGFIPWRVRCYNGLVHEGSHSRSGLRSPIFPDRQRLWDPCGNSHRVLCVLRVFRTPTRRSELSHGCRSRIHSASKPCWTPALRKATTGRGKAARIANPRRRDPAGGASHNRRCTPSRSGQPELRQQRPHWRVVLIVSDFLFLCSITWAVRVRHAPFGRSS